MRSVPRAGALASPGPESEHRQGQQPLRGPEQGPPAWRLHPGTSALTDPTLTSQNEKEPPAMVLLRKVPASPAPSPTQPLTTGLPP